MKRFLILGTWLCVLVCAEVARGERTFVAYLDGLQNISPLPDVTATGSAVFVLNDAETELTFHIEYSGLSSAEVGAHIHEASPRDIGPLIFELPLGTPKHGVWYLSPMNVLYLTSKHLYVSIHTEDHYTPPELRGNIFEQTTPVVPTTWGAVKALFGVGFQ